MPVSRRASDDEDEVLVVYAETSAIVAISVPDDMYHGGAARIFDAVLERGNCQLVTSEWAIAEAASAIRKKITRSHRMRTGSEGERAAVDAKADESVARMIKLMRTMSKQGVLKIIKLGDMPINIAFLPAKVHEHAGRAVRDARGKFYRYRGVGPCDWPQFALAKHANASIIITSDMAFAGIAGNDKDFGHIRIQMINAPPIGLLTGKGE